MDKSKRIPKWHFAIPFYFGKNRYVTARAGAPVNKKVDFLSQTIMSIVDRFVDPDIIITVCDPKSEQTAKKVYDSVVRIDCKPLYLPYDTVRFLAHKASAEWEPDDIAAFNEDDQILYISESVKEDIEQYGDRFFFSPHRWARTRFFNTIGKKPVLKVNNRKGIIDNVDNVRNGASHVFRRRYLAQNTQSGAYAACWASRCTSLGVLDFPEYEKNAGRICLESASFILLHTSLPVLKLDLNTEDPKNFLVDHLSGFFYFSRAVSLKRLWNHIRHMKF